MQQVHQALDEVKELYNKVVGHPAPDIRPDAYVAFPPGVNPLDHALQEVAHLKRLSEQLSAIPAPAQWVPQADTFVGRDAYVVRLEIPGVDHDSLKVLASGGECVVRGERKPPEAAEELRPLTLERALGTFERRFMLPTGADPERMHARYHEGILELKIEIEPEGAPRETKVEVG